MQVQELSYLRDELNQRIRFTFENSSKTIGQILMMWSGALILFTIAKPIEINENSVIATFIVLLLFLISNLIISFSVQKDYNNAAAVCKLASYIIVFYEMEHANDRENNHIFWEIANIKIEAERNIEVKERKSRSWYAIINEYTIIGVISAFLILFLSAYFLLVIFSASIFDVSKLDPIVHTMYIVLFVLSLIVLYISITQIFKIRKKASFNYRLEKEKQLEIFLDYAIKNKHYSEAYVKERFGLEFLEIIHYKVPSER
jgi:hypothetical protein